MTTRRRKGGPGNANDVPTRINEILADLLVVQCRMSTLEGEVPFEDLIFCRRLVAAASSEMGNLKSSPMH